MAAEDNHPQSLTAHPDYAAMREEANRLRAELAVLLLQRDDLEMNQNPRIEAAYLRRFGALELKTYEAYCGCLRAKRKSAMVRASLNRREPVDLEAVEAVLDRELETYSRGLQDRMETVSRAMESKPGSGLTKAGREELKTCYRTVIKALHPDLHPDSGEKQRQLLQKAVNAYRHRDLETLRAVCDSLRQDEEPETEDSFEILRAEVRRLRGSVRRFNEELEAMKAAYPYSMRAYLKNEELAARRQAELTEKLQVLRDRTAAYESAIREMLQPEEDEL